MMKSASLWTACLAAGMLLACSSSGGGGAGDGGTGSGSSSGGSGSSSGGGSTGISLSVVSATTAATVGGLGPMGGNFFLVVDLTMKNTGAPNPLSTNPVLFTVRTSQSLDVSASPAQPTGACNPSVSVASGGQTSCSVAFQVPVGQTPTTLAYDDQRGDVATAALPEVATPTAACETYDGWFKTTPKMACIQCLGGAEGVFDAGSAPCESAAKAYGSACNACAQMCNVLSGTNDPCACELGCDSASCQMLFDTYVSCLVQTCTGQCP